MGTAWSYSTDPCNEHDAVRDAVGMFDMSPLKKIFVRGPDAASVLDHLTTRDIGRMAPGQAAYLSILTERGTRALSQALAAGSDVAIELDDHRLPSSLNTCR